MNHRLATALALVSALAAVTPATAGNVNATVSKGRLRVLGSRSADVVTLSPGTLVGDVVVTAGAGTTVNGGASATFSGVTEDVRVSLDDGDDRVEIAGLDPISRKMRVTTGRGDDIVRLMDVDAVRDVRVITSSGADQVDCAGITTDRYRVSAGRGSDRMDQLALYVREGARISAGDGDDLVTLAGSEFLDVARISTAGGDDQVTLGTSIFHDFLGVSLSSGADTVSWSNLTLDLDGVFDGDKGTDTANDGGGNTIGGTLTLDEFELP